MTRKLFTTAILVTLLGGCGSDSGSSDTDAGQTEAVSSTEAPALR